MHAAPNLRPSPFQTHLPLPPPPAVGDFRGLAALAHMFVSWLARRLGLLSGADGLGTANTALAVHAGRVLAL